MMLGKVHTLQLSRGKGCVQKREREKVMVRGEGREVVGYRWHDEQCSRRGRHNGDHNQAPRRVMTYGRSRSSAYTEQ